MKILIIDDDPVICYLLEEILKEQGYRTVKAHSGQEGIDQFIRHQPNLVILDIQMPAMDGCQTAKEIKRRNEGRFVPIVFITASNDDIKMADCIDAGGDDLILKPFARNLLEAKIRAWERNLKSLSKPLSDTDGPVRQRATSLTREEINDLLE